MSVRVLAQIARSKAAPAAARVVAANSLLDRGWGKADVVHAGPDGGPIQVIIRQLVDVIQHSDPLTIERQVIVRMPAAARDYLTT
jgi:hypothetical protein